jgi:amidase
MFLLVFLFLLLPVLSFVVFGRSLLTGRYDVLITPTVPYVANTHPAPDGTIIQRIQKSLGQNSNCSIFNSTGHPGLSLPVGMLAPNDGEGDQTVRLPVGMQLVGKCLGEQTLFQVAHTFERNFDWKSL